MESPSSWAYDLGDRKSKRSKTGESGFRKNKLIVVSFLACPAIPGEYMHASILDLEDRPDSDDSNGNPPLPPPIIRIEGSYGMDQGWGFCVLDSILYMSGEKKSVYKVDLSKLSTCTSDNYRAEKIDAEMLGVKNRVVSTAISMPDGRDRVLVFSTRDLCADSSLRTTIDFEIYDPNTGLWEILPGSDKWGMMQLFGLISNHSLFPTTRSLSCSSKRTPMTLQSLPLISYSPIKAGKN
ncbi:unnamed protein product [Cuscuta europaea]|uniref:Uncharacterized protein n=1 Tax=Cuscuta europaea TaxID=41803 RepID=A0A9P0YNW4_CUSEU|nr:unnamed protein product [Cuscuta europaea]